MFNGIDFSGQVMQNQCNADPTNVWSRGTALKLNLRHKLSELHDYMEAKLLKGKSSELVSAGRLTVAMDAECL